MSYGVILVGDYPGLGQKGSLLENEPMLLKIIDGAIKAEEGTFESLYLADESVDEAALKKRGADLKKKLLKLKPKVIVPLGEKAMMALTGQTGIMKNRGRVIEWFAEDGTRVCVVPSFSVFYVRKSPHYMTEFAEDLYSAYKIALGLEDSRPQTTTVVEVKTVDQAKQAIDYCKQVGVCCFDFETVKLTDLVTFDPEFRATLLSLSFQMGSSYAIPLDHFESPFTKSEKEEILDYFFVKLLYDPKVLKIGHNVGFDMHVAARYGAEKFRGRFDDTMLMHHILDETKRHGLKEIVKEYFPDCADYEKAVKQFGWDKVPLSLLVPYGGMDTDLTLRLRYQFIQELIRDERCYRLYRNHTASLLKTMFKAEEEGMLVEREQMIRNIKRAEELRDMVESRMRENRVVRRYEASIRTEKLDQLIAELEKKKEGLKGKRLQDCSDKIMSLKLGEVDPYEGINFASTKQLGLLLYSHPDGFNFPVPYVKKKRTYDEATGKEYLEDLKDKTGFIQDLLLLRSIEKTLSTYLYGILERLDGHDRVHSSFLIHGTATGRLSSQNPNLQNLTNVSKLTDEVAIEVVSMVKKPFTAPEGYKFVQLDYSQAELRIIAEFAKEENMIKAYDEGKDLHALYAATMLETTLEEFYKLDAKEQKKWRTRAKAGNFGLIYGMSADGLVAYAKTNYGVILTFEEAVKMRNAFFRLYPALLDYHDRKVEQGQTYGYVRTLFGRKRRLPQIWDDNDFVRSMDERVAINSPVQGTAGELTLFACTLLRLRLDPRVKFVNTIHDSIILYVPDDLVEEQLALAKQTCENLPTLKYFGRELKIKMQVDIEISNGSWTECKPYAA